MTNLMQDDDGHGASQTPNALRKRAKRLAEAQERAEARQLAKQTGLNAELLRHMREAFEHCSDGNGHPEDIARAYLETVRVTQAMGTPDDTQIAAITVLQQIEHLVRALTDHVIDEMGPHKLIPRALVRETQAA